MNVNNEIRLIQIKKDFLKKYDRALKSFALRYEVFRQYFITLNFYFHSNSNSQRKTLNIQKAKK